MTLEWDGETRAGRQVGVSLSYVFFFFSAMKRSYKMKSKSAAGDSISNISVCPEDWLDCRGQRGPRDPVSQMSISTSGVPVLWDCAGTLERRSRDHVSSDH